MSTVKLTVTPDSYYFTNIELPELHKMLLEVDRHTIVTPASTLGDLCMTPEGKTETGYSYSDGALIQLCGLVAPGLAQLVMDLSGQWRKPGADTRLYSGVLAVDVLNKAIRLRFDRKLLGLQLVRDNKRKVIDGIVGSKYRYLANSDFLSRVEQECSVRRSKFHEACLYGRHFIVRFVNQDTDKVQYAIDDHVYNFGYHFANSEIGGKSVRAATLLVRLDSGDCALCPFTAGTGGRVVHSGRDFEKRLHALMGQIIQKLPHKEEIENGGQMLLGKSLHLGDDHEKRVRYLTQILTRRKLTQNFARRVISSAASKGKDNSDTLTEELPAGQRLVLATRSGYDLFVALIREAKKLPIDQRETAEQVAYALLSGKIGF